MKKICFYTSDYGYGHAARDIALIREIQKAGFAKIFIKTGSTFNFMSHSLPRCTIVEQRNDIGPIYKKDSIEVDKGLTERVLEDWIASWDKYIRSEKKFCQDKEIDLILSDITPQSLLVADDMGIPGVGFSNFTWHYIFSNLLGNCPAVENLEAAYRAGDLALVLPFNEGMTQFKKRKEIGLVSRKITTERETFRTQLGLQDDELLIYLGLGKSLNSGIITKLKGLSLKKMKILISSDVALPRIISQEKVIRIPATETESQNYLAMADLVVSKTGYSTVSEAIHGRVPMFLFRRKGFEEDRLIANGVESLGIGREIQVDDFVQGKWIEELNDLDRYNNSFNCLRNMFKSNGASEAVETIKEMIL